MTQDRQDFQIIAVARALGLAVQEHGQGEAWIPCPASTHGNDAERPRCGLSDERGAFNCLKCGVSGDAVGLVKLALGVEAGEAFRWLRERLGGGDSGPQGNVEDDPIGYLARLRGWSVEAFKAMGCFGKGRSVHFPMRDAAGKVTGHRIRRGDGSTYDGGVKALTQRGSKNGVLGVWPLPENDGRPVLLTEGEADAAAALAAEWSAVLATPGSTPGHQVEEALQRLLAGRRVVLTPDPDEAGRKWLARIAGNLAAAGCEVFYIPQIDGKDLDRRLRGPMEGRAAELARLVAGAIPWKPPGAGKEPPGGEDGGDGSGPGEGGGDGGAGGAKPPDGAGEGGEVLVGTDEARVADDVLKILRRCEPEMFQRSGQLVTVCGAGDAGGVRRFGGLVIAPVSAPWVRDTATRHIQFIGFGEGGKRKKVHPPDWLGKALVSRTKWPGLPELVGVANYPVLTTGGLMTAQGYDEASGWLITPNVRAAGLTAKPQGAQIAAARALLHEPVVDFPFAAGPMGEAAWVAMVLTILARPSIDGPAPLFLADASTRGSGKTKLVSIGGMIATGAPPACVPEAADGDEERKRILAILSAGDPLVLLDNANRLGGSSLDALLTSLLWKDRTLGKSEVRTLPNLAVWAATANNPLILGDTRRRILPMRLQPDVEQPESRENFKHANLEAWVLEHRAELLGAALSLLAGWHAAGRPDMGLKPWGSYEAWTAVVRACLVWAGYPDPIDCRDELTVSADPEAAQLGALLELLQWSGKALSAKAIIGALQPESGFSGDAAEAVREAATGGNGGVSARALGKKLERWRGRVAGNLRLKVHPGRSGIQCYSAESISDGGFGCDGGFIPAPYAHTHDARAHDTHAREPREQTHQSLETHQESAAELRARLLARGVLLKLEEGVRLVVLGRLEDGEAEEVKRLRPALIELLKLDERRDAMPF